MLESAELTLDGTAPPDSSAAARSSVASAPPSTSAGHHERREQLVAVAPPPPRDHQHDRVVQPARERREKAPRAFILVGAGAALSNAKQACLTAAAKIPIADEFGMAHRDRSAIIERGDGLTLRWLTSQQMR